MALVVFLRGVNVGGHRRFRPSIFARTLTRYDVVNVGATGTFVVRKPGPRAKFRAMLARKLPFDAQISICDSRDILALASNHPFGAEPPRAGVTGFVSILPKPSRFGPALPIALPSEDDWLVRIIAARGRFVFGTYRRHMKTIGYLGQIDELFGAPATTRNWNTITSLVRILNGLTPARSPTRAAGSRSRPRS